MQCSSHCNCATLAMNCCSEMVGQLGHTACTILGAPGDVLQHGMPQDHLCPTHYQLGAGRMRHSFAGDSLSLPVKMSVGPWAMAPLGQRPEPRVRVPASQFPLAQAHDHPQAPSARLMVDCPACPRTYKHVRGERLLRGRRWCNRLIG
jgi:hypothetical protein